MAQLDLFHGQSFQGVFLDGDTQAAAFQQRRAAAQRPQVQVVHVGETGARWEFRRLPARPMLRRDVPVDGMSARMLDSEIRAIIADAPSDAVLCLRIAGAVTDEQLRVVSARRMRAIAPDTMNVELSVASLLPRTARRSRRTAALR